ncbi:MAG: TraR/DksA family transcriptional regulator [Acidobacteriota bacterium]|nr:TraR/DksA family transcriptional regulator [Acidobacteriota bacterium]
MLASAKKKKNGLDEARGLLEEKRQELARRLSERRAEITRVPDTDDEGADALESVVKDMTFSAMEREVRTITEIDLSLKRIASGEYGVCGSCGETIPAARLRAIPWTRVCVECAGGALQPLNPDSGEPSRRMSSK